MVNFPRAQSLDGFTPSSESYFLSTSTKQVKEIPLHTWSSGEEPLNLIPFPRSFTYSQSSEWSERTRRLSTTCYSLPHSVTRYQAIQDRNAQVLVASFCYTVRKSFFLFSYLFIFYILIYLFTWLYMYPYTSCRWIKIVHHVLSFLILYFC
jgi:hypothetical protein